MLAPSIQLMRPAEPATSEIIRKISANRVLGIAASASLNATWRAWPTTFGRIPIVTGRSPTRSEHEEERLVRADSAASPAPLVRPLPRAFLQFGQRSLSAQSGRPISHLQRGTAAVECAMFDRKSATWRCLNRRKFKQEAVVCRLQEPAETLIDRHRLAPIAEGFRISSLVVAPEPGAARRVGGKDRRELAGLAHQSVRGKEVELPNSNLARRKQRFSI